MEELVLFEYANEGRTVGVVTINRPQVHNALNGDVFTALVETFSTLPLTVRAVVLRGTPSGKDNKFQSACAGADLGTLVRREGDQYLPLTFAEAELHLQEGLKAIASLNRLKERTDHLVDETARPSSPLVAIGAISGPLLAGGLELFLGVCDMIVASESSALGLPEYDLAGLAGWGGPERLMKLLGGNEQRCKYLLLGNTIKAKKAEEWGLVTLVVPDIPTDKFMGEALAIANKVAQGDPLATKYNLELAERPLTENRTPLATAYMSYLITQQPWVREVEKFFEKRRK